MPWMTMVTIGVATLGVDDAVEGIKRTGGVRPERYSMQTNRII